MKISTPSRSLRTTHRAKPSTVRLEAFVHHLQLLQILGMGNDLRPKTIVYVDGFNLYRQALKGTSYRWLNISMMLEKLLPDFSIGQIKYFTARVTPTPHNPSIHIRQGAYFRALQCDPRMEIYLGKFISKVANRPIHPWTYDRDGRFETVKVKEFLEKGSDVNLSANFVNDVLSQRADRFVILTNDSDQQHSFEVIDSMYFYQLGLILPSRKPSKDLLRLQLPLVRVTRSGVLKESQFPAELEDNFGRFHKPESW